MNLSRSPIRGRYHYTKKEKQYLSHILKPDRNVPSPRFKMADSVARTMFVEDPVKIDERKAPSEPEKPKMKTVEVKMPEINPGDLLFPACSSSVSGNTRAPVVTMDTT
mmetsp:Transcript_7850/g.10784  ORF Transcript_7850/g.10784 Transcript_7850/m.10784 type:complete len:108 (-) Transcript_7850:101-424(-)